MENTADRHGFDGGFGRGFGDDAGGRSGRGDPYTERFASRGRDDHAWRQRELERLRNLAHLLDDAFTLPVINKRFGLDALLGLVPVVGDFSGLLIGAYLVYRGARLGASVETLSRMIVNLVIDGVIGSIPLLGDVFDFFFKANKRNLRLLERHLQGAH